MFYECVKGYDLLISQEIVFIPRLVLFLELKVKYLPNKCPLNQNYQINQIYTILSVLPKHNYENDYFFFWKDLLERALLKPEPDQ